LLSDVREYIADKQAIIDRLLTQAYEANEIDEVSYRRLSATVCETGEWTGIFAHFEAVLWDFIESSYNHILGRIVQGAEFIERLQPGDKRLVAAEVKYESLIGQASRLRNWLDEHDGKEIGA